MFGSGLSTGNSVYFVGECMCGLIRLHLCRLHPIPVPGGFLVHTSGRRGAAVPCQENKSSTVPCLILNDYSELLCTATQNTHFTIDVVHLNAEAAEATRCAHAHSIISRRTEADAARRQSCSCQHAAWDRTVQTKSTLLCSASRRLPHLSVHILIQSQKHSPAALVAPSGCPG